MNAEAYESLTRSERAVLRLLSREREIGEVAETLGLTVSTVETYIKTARRKLGGVSRYVAARNLRDHEASLNGGSLVRGLPEQVSSSDIEAVGEAMPPNRQDRVREESAVFDFGDGPPTHRSPVGMGAGSAGSALLRLLMVVGVAVAIAALLLLAIPLGEGAQRLANVIDPPHG